MTKVIITNKGASMKSNHWKCGQIIECHENLAELFIKNGVAESIDKQEEEPVKKNKKK